MKLIEQITFMKVIQKQNVVVVILFKQIQTFI